MSRRLDQEREQRLQPRRMASARATLESMGYAVEEEGGTALVFQHRGETVWLWPYSGWFSGKSVCEGRGFGNLARQLLSTGELLGPENQGANCPLEE